MNSELKNIYCRENNILAPVMTEIITKEVLTESETMLTIRFKDNQSFIFEPGQIVEAGVFGFGEIPLGIASSPTNVNNFNLVIRKSGKVSAAITQLNAGDFLSIRGPLGNGFPLEELYDDDVLVIAGGLGLVPTRSLIYFILENRSKFKNFTVFYGARSPKDILFKEDLSRWWQSTEVDYYSSVDTAPPNWRGNIGVITTLFDKAKNIHSNTKVIVCGPPIMYKFVMRELEKLEISKNNIYLDLERRMKCGVGKCGHCQMRDKYICIDGPVFQYSQIHKYAEAI